MPPASDAPVTNASQSAITRDTGGRRAIAPAAMREKRRGTNHLQPWIGALRLMPMTASAASA